MSESCGGRPVLAKPSLYLRGRCQYVTRNGKKNASGASHMASSRYETTIYAAAAILAATSLASAFDGEFAFGRQHDTFPSLNYAPQNYNPSPGNGNGLRSNNDPFSTPSLQSTPASTDNARPRRRRSHRWVDDDETPRRSKRRYAVSTSNDDETPRPNRRRFRAWSDDDQGAPQHRKRGRWPWRSDQTLTKSPSYGWGSSGHAAMLTASPSSAAGGGIYRMYGATLACVRRCDGSFFSVGHLTTYSLDAQESLCKAQCPNAEVQLYMIPPGGDGIGSAVSLQGKPYSKMPNALRYTKEYDAACTCRGRTSQAQLVALKKDFTMRRGDAIMTENGLKIFLGAYHWPYTDADFQVLDKAKYLLANGLALAELEKATKPLQQIARHDGEDDDPNADDEPIFVAGLNGKKVRLIGNIATYAPSAAPIPGENVAAAGSWGPSLTSLSAARSMSDAVEAEPTVPAEPAADIVPLWRPRSAAP